MHAPPAQAMLRLLRRQSTRGLVDDLLGDTVGLLGRPSRLPGGGRSSRLPRVQGGGNGAGSGALAEEEEHECGAGADGAGGAHANGAQPQP